MINKGILLLLIPIAFSRIINEAKLEKLPKKIILEDDTPIYKLPQYGSITVSGSVIAYIELEGFKKGDSVYLEFSFEDFYLISNTLTIQYMELASWNDTNAELKKASSSSYSQSGSTYTYYVSVKLEKDCKVFVFLTPNIHDSSTGKSITYKIINSPVYKLPQYGEITISGSVIAYIELDGFKKGDNIYLEFVFENFYLIDNSISIQYAEQASLDSIGQVKEATSSSYSTSGSTYTYYISVKLETDCKYFIFITPNFSIGNSITYKIRHTKSSTIAIIIAVVVIIVILAVIGVLFYCYRRRKLLDSYPQPNYQAQPVYQAPSAY